MPAPDRPFVPLGAWLRGEIATAPAEPAEAPPAAPPAVPPAVIAGPDADASLAALRDVRVFRAHLADAFDAARIALVREFAFAVIGRELLLAPADVDAIAARVLAEHPRAQCVRVRVAPGDVSIVRAGVPVESDPALAPGDAVVEIAGGSIDARLGVRLAQVLAAWS
jgi:hypothetical protein